MNQRPVNLNLTTIRFPIMALVSITHRITGVLLFLAIPLFLWLLALSLRSPASFLAATDLLQAPLLKFACWGILTALLYHLLAGIKHLLMDAHCLDETLVVARPAAHAVWMSTAAVSIALFIRLFT